MREKLRNYVKGVSRMDARGLKQKYKGEARELVGDTELPQSFSFYLSLFDTGADFITGNNGEKDKNYFTELLQKQYVDFSKALI